MKGANWRSIACTAMLIGTFGCGGGGGGSSSTGGGGDGGGSPANYGPVSVMAIGAVKPPVVIGSRSAVFTAVFGAGFSSVRATLPPASSLPVAEVLAQTSIVVDNGGQSMLYDYGTGQLNSIGMEEFYGNSSSPEISRQGDKVVMTHYVDGVGLEVFTEALDGTARKQITNGPNWAYDPSLSADGKTVVYTAYGSGTGYKSVLFSVPVTGGTPTQLTSTDDNCVKSACREDGRIAYFRQAAATGNFIPYLMKADGTEATQIPFLYSAEDPNTASLSFFPGTGGHDGMMTRYAGGFYYLERINDTKSSYYLIYTTDQVDGVSCSPVGSYCVYRRFGANPGIYIMDTTTGNQWRILSGYSFADPSWGPYVTNRNLIGKSGSLGSSAGGFLFGQIGDAIKSFVAFDATTRSTITVVKQDNPNPNQANAVCTVSADNVTLLKYVNGFGGSSVTVASANSPITGAVVSFNADTGRISSVVPYNGSAARLRPGTQTYEARFVGAWDGKGKNVAPNGATQVSLDPKTGDILSVR